MRVAELSPNSLIATVESIRGGLFRPEQRQGLVDAGFDWTRFERTLGDLQAARVGFSRGYFPIRLQLDEPGNADKAAPLLAALREQLAQLRELGPKVFSGNDQIHTRIQCTAPDGTPHAELASCDPSRVYVVALQDFNEFIRDEIPHLTRMTSAWAIYLFGNYLSDADLEHVNFRWFRELRELDLAENRLTRVPAGVVDCGKLELLSLARNNNLRSLPAELGRLRSLRVLDLSGTGVSAQAIRQATTALPNCDVRV